MTTDAKTRRTAALQTPTDLKAEATHDVSAALNALLADVFALYMKTKNFHWHMSGPPGLPLGRARDSRSVEPGGTAPVACGILGLCPTSPPSPSTVPTARELDDLELLTHGALRAGRLRRARRAGHADRAARGRRGRAGRPASLELVDPEGLPLARVAVRSTYDAGGLTGITGPVTAADAPPVRRVPPAATSPPPRSRSAYDDRTLTVPVAGPLTDQDLDPVRRGRRRRPVVLLALNGTGTPQGVTPASGCSAATLAAAAALLGDALTWSPCPLRLPRRRRRPTTSSASGWSRRYAPGDVLGGHRRGRVPDEVAASSTHDQPADRRAGARGLLHRPVRERQVDAGPGAARPDPRATASAR